MSAPAGLDSHSRLTFPAKNRSNAFAMSDKYPIENDRRRFVKGVVGGGSLAGVSAGAMTAIESAVSTPGEGGGQVVYYGVENVAGPADRPLPQVPMTVEDGEVHGVWPGGGDGGNDGDGTPEMELGGITYTPEWYQYCGVEAAAGLRPGADRDTAFRHVDARATPYDWQAEREAGTPVRVEDFADYEAYDDVGESGLGKPAMAEWRTRDDDATTVTVQVVRSPRIEELAAESEWLAASTDRGFLAFLTKCTHFCCVPGFKRPTTAGTDGADRVHCPCHQSEFDLFSIVKATGTVRPRPPDP